MDLKQLNYALYEMRSCLKESSIKSIWGIKSSRRKYSSPARDILKKTLPTIRKKMARTLQIEKGANSKGMYYAGKRFNNAQDILDALESNVSEVEFTSDPEKYLAMVLAGAAETDYYYEFEKEY